ncbi:hypothetical protein Dimus_035441, partial [Dionaea muscipula]
FNSCLAHHWRLSLLLDFVHHFGVGPWTGRRSSSLSQTAGDDDSRSDGRRAGQRLSSAIALGIAHSDSMGPMVHAVHAKRR